MTAAPIPFATFDPADAATEAAILDALYDEVASYKLPPAVLAHLGDAVVNLSRFVDGPESEVGAAPRVFRAPLTRARWLRSTPSIRRAMILRFLAAQEAEKIAERGRRDAVR